MTLQELKTRLETEKHFIGPLEVACGTKSELPYIFGIYEEIGRAHV